MKLIDYDKHRMEIRKMVHECMFSPSITCKEGVNKIMAFLDSLPADYTEERVKEIDQAYQRVCKELEEARSEAEEQRAFNYAGVHWRIMNRINKIRALLLQYPEAASNMIGRLDELNMMREKFEKMAAGERRNDLSTK